MVVQIQCDRARDVQRGVDGNILRQLIGAVGQAAGYRYIGADVILRQRNNRLALAAQRHWVPLRRGRLGRGSLLRFLFFLRRFRLRLDFLLLLCRCRAVVLRGKSRCRQQRQTQAQCCQNAEYSFLHRDPSVMKVVWFFLWKNQGDIPLENLLLRFEGFEPLLGLLDGLLNDICRHSMQIHLQDYCCDRRPLFLRDVVQFERAV